MPFRESIRAVLRENFKVMNELFYMKNFNSTQMDVIKHVMKQLGVTEDPTTFLSSKQGQLVMSSFRQLLINKFGTSSNNMPNTDPSSHPGFDINNHSAREALVQELSAELITILWGHFHD